MYEGNEHTHQTRQVTSIKRAPTAIVIAGLLAIVWAVALAYSVVTFRFRTGGIEVPGSEAKPIEWLIFTLKVLAPMALSIWMVIAALGFVRLKRWARYWLFLAIALACVSQAGAIGLVGFSLSPPQTGLHLILAVAFMVFLAIPSVRARFPYRWSLKKITIVMSILIVFALVANGYIYIASGAYRMPSMKHVAYEPLAEGFYAGGYNRTELPFGYSIALPGQHRLLALTRSDSAGIVAFLETSEGHTIIMDNDPIIGRRSAYLQRMGTDPYEFTRAILSERLGVLCLLLKGMLLYPDIAHMDEAVINGLTCFSIWRKPSDIPKTTRWVEYFIFNGHEPLGQVQILTEGQGPDMPDKALKPIVLSTMPEDRPGKSAEAAFEEGLALLRQHRPEQAKLAFAYALCLDWNEPKYHYQLASIQLETEPLFQAREHAEEVLRLDPDFPSADSLLRRIEEAEDLKAAEG
jgi:tetratricopeptide (TPR) repeat protein